MALGRHLGLGFLAPVSSRCPLAGCRSRMIPRSPTRAAQTGSEHCSSPLKKRWVMEMKAEGRQKAHPCLPHSSHPASMDTTHRQTAALSACPGKCTTPKGLSMGHSFRAHHSRREAAQSQDCEKWGLASGRLWRQGSTLYQPHNGC